MAKSQVRGKKVYELNPDCPLDEHPCRDIHANTLIRSGGSIRSTLDFGTFAYAKDRASSSPRVCAEKPNMVLK
jgi:hypothetical protein